MENDHKHANVNSEAEADQCESISASATESPTCCVQYNIVGSASTDKGRSFRVSGLDCAEEVAILRRALRPVVGGEDQLAFDVLNSRMIILDSVRSAPEQVIIDAVAATGMTAEPWSEAAAEAGHRHDFNRLKTFVGLSAATWAAGIVFHVSQTGLVGLLTLFAGHGQVAVPWVETVLFILAVVFGAWHVAPKAWFAARRLAPDMNLLMIVAVAGALLIGETFEGATVAFLFALSLLLESWSVGRARDAVSKLLDLAPPTARVRLEDGTEKIVSAEQVALGQQFIVRGGDRVPLDGRVIEGLGLVNQAPITGESAPVPKEAGDDVFAGTINGDGVLTVEATKPADDTVLARIIRMVSDAHSRRAPVEQWVDRFSRIYTPTVMLLALLVFLLPPVLLGGAWATWFYNALVLLVIACPCALVISTPVAIVASLASSARNGVLVKGGAYMEMPSRLSALAMDKTGTLTKGEPEVTGVHVIEAENEMQLLSVAASLEARSSHPLAVAIMRDAKARLVDIAPATSVNVVPGRGLTGRIDGRDVWLGSPRFASERTQLNAQAQAILDGLAAKGVTSVVVGKDDGFLGVIEIADAVRPDAKETIANLHSLGVQKLVMLTGDNQRTAQSVADLVGIDQVQAELLPEDKVAAVEALTREHDVVAMIGDGINDAPAMARADFAIAMGAIGSDAAIETADVALMTDDLAKVPWLIAHSRSTMSIIRQNIAFSLLVKAVFVVLTLIGFATMWGAIAADVGASLLVVANALRLLRLNATA